MSEQQTCPHCGAEAVRLMRNGEKYSGGYECGWRIGVEKNASIERSVKCYERQIEQLQARIDELMFEHCPDEMTKEQIERYTNAQRIVEE